MYFKRFAQLFIIFLIALAVFAIIFLADFGNVWLRFFIGLVLSYIVLVLPLVILTLVKTRKKANIVGSQTETGELAKHLSNLPGFIALAVTGENGMTSTTIMSFTQSVINDNVFWMVAEKDTSKVGDLKKNSQVSFTSWFDSFENGARLSSNRVKAEVFDEPKENKNIIEAEPNILDVNENAVNLAIIKLTIQSVLYEDFKDGIKVLNLENN
ncbi:MAG: pyridoxamine 5'-phosphate oxidase family protein [Streptococcaceae bacterium]|jgi:general stress protein 26|nr:pyridoxamine 5'-phosphate oxidase family protein [Streptococcaceae bacterium]